MDLPALTLAKQSVHDSLKKSAAILRNDAPANNNVTMALVTMDGDIWNRGDII